MKNIITILILLFCQQIVAQDNNQNIRHTLHTQFVKLAIRDLNVGYEIQVKEKAAFGVNLGYRITMLNNDVENTTSYFNSNYFYFLKPFNGPHASVYVKKYMKSEKKHQPYLSIESSLQKNKYGITGVHHGSQGTGQIFREIVEDNVDILSLKLLYGIQAQLGESFQLDINGGIGYSRLNVDRHQYSWGAFGDYDEEITNSKENFIAELPTLHLGIKLAYCF